MNTLYQVQDVPNNTTKLDLKICTENKKYEHSKIILGNVFNNNKFEKLEY